MSRNFFLKMVRVVFAGVLVVVLGGVALWEVAMLRSYSDRDRVEAKSGSGENQKVMLSDQAVMIREPVVTSGMVVTADARPEKIRRYLAKYKSPLLPYADLIFEVSQTYGFDYYWIVAIGQQESNLCKKIPSDSFNCWGYGIHSKGTLRFENYELAIKSFAEYLKRTYFDKGLNTPELIMRKYCPHSDGSWSRGVSQFIEELEEGDF